MFLSLRLCLLYPCDDWKCKYYIKRQQHAHTSLGYVNMYFACLSSEMYRLIQCAPCEHACTVPHRFSLMFNSLLFLIVSLCTVGALQKIKRSFSKLPFLSLLILALKRFGSSSQWLTSDDFPLSRPIIMQANTSGRSTYDPFCYGNTQAK